MPTKYDVFAKIVEIAPCKAKDLEFNSPIYAHINKLKELKLIEEKAKMIVPVKNKHSKLIFDIIKYCLKNGLDYNLFFSKSTEKILSILPEKIPDLRPPKLKGNKESKEVLSYLEKNQFILKYSNRPAKGRMLKHQLITKLIELFELKIKKHHIKSPNLLDKILSIKEEPINPFDLKIFSFLSGSAQLEGSTITEGETKEIILNDIYPDKPAKDIQMVKNLNEALRFILENVSEKITPDLIKEINKLVMFSMHRNAGKYKIVQNKIQGNPDFKTAKPSEVESLMEQFCNNIESINSKKEALEKIGFFHNEIQRIHPFSDGNSRTTRMIMNWVLLKHNLPLCIIKMGAFDEYMSLTKLSQKRDDERLTQLIHELIIHEQLVK